MDLLNVGALRGQRRSISRLFVRQAAGRQPAHYQRGSTARAFVSLFRVVPKVSATFVTAVAVKSFDAPDKKRCPDKAEFDFVTVNDYSVARLILEPGWRWSECIKPLEETEFCEHNHLGFCISGVMEIETADGLHSTIRANDTYTLPPGHDEWVVGSEPFVAVEFLGAASLGRPASHGMHARI